GRHTTRTWGEKGGWGASEWLHGSELLAVLKPHAWCHRPVVPATQEAELTGSLEPRSSGQQCAMPSRPLR
uniref:Uncharacterized protein n=1 Tax=Melopsittacus undulatus TaxID=13146 RepID=A0A8V5GVH4_MELUD